MKEIERVAALATLARETFDRADGAGAPAWTEVVLALRAAELQRGRAGREQARSSRGRRAEPGDYVKTFAEFWAPLVLDERTGQLDADKVARELHDFSHLLDQVPEVYSHVTGGMLSKTTYYAGDVCQVADEYAERQAEQAVAEAREEMLRDVQAAAAGAFDDLARRVAEHGVQGIHAELIEQRDALNDQVAGRRCPACAADDPAQRAGSEGDCGHAWHDRPKVA